MTCVQGRKKALKKRLNAFQLSPWVWRDFGWTLDCAAETNDVWLMSFLASIKSLELRWPASTSCNKSGGFAWTWWADQSPGHLPAITFPFQVFSVGFFFLMDTKMFETLVHHLYPVLVCCWPLTGRQQVHLQQTAVQLIVKGKRWFTPAKESIGPQRSLASSSCTTVYLMHLALKPMRCLNHYLLLWWNGPEILGRWTVEAVASELLDQLGRCLHGE